MLEDPHSVRQRLWQAVAALATSAQPIQRRLEAAAQELVHLRADEFADPEARAEFIAIGERVAVREEASGDEASLARPTSAMSDDEAERVAQKIVTLDAMYREL